MVDGSRVMVQGILFSSGFMVHGLFFGSLFII